jgi:hypothetical protein
MKIEVTKEELQEVIWALKHQRRQLSQKSAELKATLRDTKQLEQVLGVERASLRRLMEKLVTNKNGDCRLCGLNVEYHGCTA